MADTSPVSLNAVWDGSSQVDRVESDLELVPGGTPARNPVGARLGGRIGSPVGAVAATLVVGYIVIVGVLATVGLFLTQVLLSGPIGHWDESTTRWLTDHRTGGLNSVTGFATRMADTLGAIGLGLVIIAVSAIHRHWRQIVIVITGLALELVCFLTVNTLVDRPRPAVNRLGSLPSTSSFPSGHTAATVVIYGSIALFVSWRCRNLLLRAAAWAAAVVMPVGVGFSRVYRGMHHPLDVIGGLALGVLVLVVVLMAFDAMDAAGSGRRGSGTPDDLAIEGVR